MKDRLSRATEAQLRQQEEFQGVLSTLADRDAQGGSWVEISASCAAQRSREIIAITRTSFTHLFRLCVAFAVLDLERRARRAELRVESLERDLANAAGIDRRLAGA